MQNKRKISKFKPFVIIFILIITSILAYQIFGAARFETILSSEGEVIDGFWTEALIVRDEEVVYSPSSGRVDLKTGEGDRLAAGKKLAEINNNDRIIEIFNKKAGVISYAVDGLEEEINLNNINNISLNNFSDYRGEYSHLLSGRNIEQGQPLYRIINNFDLNLITAVSEEQANRFRINEIIFIEEKNSNDLIRAQVTDIRHGLEQSFLYIKLDLFMPKWLNIRRININVIKNIYRGIKVPRKAVFNQPSGQGVLKVTGYNSYEFQEITILDGNSEEVIVSGLEIGEEIITNPEDFNYGREG